MGTTNTFTLYLSDATGNFDAQVNRQPGCNLNAAVSTQVFGTVAVTQAGQVGCGVVDI